MIDPEMYIDDIDPEIYYEFSGGAEEDSYPWLNDEPLVDMNEDQQYDATDFDQVLADDHYTPDALREEFDALQEELAEEVNYMSNSAPSATLMGVALALADEVTSEGKMAVDENTDRENWAKAMRMQSIRDGAAYSNKKLRRFEQYVDNICKGKQSLFE